MWKYIKNKFLYWTSYYFKKWNYLGYTSLAYTNSENNAVTSRNTIHFWGKGENLVFRKISNLHPSFKYHIGFQEGIYPWTVDNNVNLYHPIHCPSEWLKQYTKDKTGYEFINSVWVKPAPAIEKTGNVLYIQKS